MTLRVHQRNRRQQRLPGFGSAINAQHCSSCPCPSCSSNILTRSTTLTRLLLPGGRQKLVELSQLPDYCPLGFCWLDWLQYWFMPLSSVIHSASRLWKNSTGLQSSTASYVFPFVMRSELRHLQYIFSVLVLLQRLLLRLLQRILLVRWLPSVSFHICNIFPCAAKNCRIQMKPLEEGFGKDSSMILTIQSRSMSLRPAAQASHVFLW